MARLVPLLMFLVIMMAGQGDAMAGNSNNKEVKVAVADPCSGLDWTTDPDYTIELWAQCFVTYTGKNFFQPDATDQLASYFVQRHDSTEKKKSTIEKHLKKMDWIKADPVRVLLIVIYHKLESDVCDGLRWTTDHTYTVKQWAQCFVLYYLKNYVHQTALDEITGYFRNRNTEAQTKQKEITDYYNSIDRYSYVMRRLRENIYDVFHKAGASE